MKDYPTNEDLSEPDDWEDQGGEFVRCMQCDGHDACEDFGCAFDLGLGRMVKEGIELGNDDWS